DFEKITGHCTKSVTRGRREIWIGTVGRSAAIDSLLKSGQLPREELEGKREKFIVTVVDKPSDGVDSALVIVGSDKRGTIYGIYELSEQMGVSPWYFWADVPIERHSDLFVKPGVYTDGEPAVEYRGIFLNDEFPALTQWVNHTFGGYNN